jgi:membrane associated rhomboid family serine protease
MSSAGQVTMALPRPGPALKIILIVVGAFGVLQTAIENYASGGSALADRFRCTSNDSVFFEPWRLVTSCFLTNAESFNHLLFTLLGLYFLSPEIERRWGSTRFVRFLLTSVIVGNLFSIAAAHISSSLPNTFFGADAAIAAIGVAWAREFPDQQIRLFFFLPVKGRALLGVTAAFAVLGVISPRSVPAGPAAPFGAILVGLLLGGTPSPLRTAYLKLRLRSLGRKAAASARIDPDVTDVRVGGPTRRARSNAPPIRIAYGGLEEELKKRKPPKDKRYLN